MDSCFAFVEGACWARMDARVRSCVRFKVREPLGPSSGVPEGAGAAEPRTAARRRGVFLSRRCRRLQAVATTDSSDRRSAVLSRHAAAAHARAGILRGESAEETHTGWREHPSRAVKQRTAARAPAPPPPPPAPLGPSAAMMSFLSVPSAPQFLQL